jgi:hypothetical protein
LPSAGRNGSRAARAAALISWTLSACPSAVGAEPPAAPPAAPTAATTVSELLVLARRPTTLSGVDVKAKAPCVIPRPHGAPDGPPRVVDSYPRFGQTVPPGVLVLRVTYDQPMSRCPVFLLNAGGALARLEQKLAWQTSDRRTMFFIVDVNPANDYRLWLNAPWRMFLRRTFLSRYGTPAVPRMIAFSTSRGPPTVTAEDVLRADPGLGPLLVPASVDSPPRAP